MVPVPPEKRTGPGCRLGYRPGHIQAQRVGLPGRDPVPALIRPQPAAGAGVDRAIGPPGHAGPVLLRRRGGGANFGAGAETRVDEPHGVEAAQRVAMRGQIIFLSCGRRVGRQAQPLQIV